MWVRQKFEFQANRSASRANAISSFVKLFGWMTSITSARRKLNFRALSRCFFAHNKHSILFSRAPICQSPSQTSCVISRDCIALMPSECSTQKAASASATIAEVRWELNFQFVAVAFSFNELQQMRNWILQHRSARQRNYWRLMFEAVVRSIDD